MKKYSLLNDIVKREFETLGVFSREIKIPKQTLSALINGKYGADEARVMERVVAGLKKLRPDLDLSHIWDPSYGWYQKFLLEKSTVRNGFRIMVDVWADDEGRLTIAPRVEGY
ncbi:MAG: hypothetical protein FJ130_05225 [Deltaproteobacteria bacterium]|nr:hypothetical protein [Deltaproteobacteria bacterium]